MRDLKRRLDKLQKAAKPVEDGPTCLKRILVKHPHGTSETEADRGRRVQEAIDDHRRKAGHENCRPLVIANTLSEPLKPSDTGEEARDDDE